MVAAVFTPSDAGITAIIGRIVDEIRPAHELQPWCGSPHDPAVTPRGSRYA